MILDFETYGLSSLSGRSAVVKLASTSFTDCTVVYLLPSPCAITSVDICISSMDLALTYLRVIDSGTSSVVNSLTPVVTVDISLDNESMLTSIMSETDSICVLITFETDNMLTLND